jgi:hypothetical protein
MKKKYVEEQYLDQSEKGGIRNELKNSPSASKQSCCKLIHFQYRLLGNSAKIEKKNSFYLAAHR